MKFSLNQRNAFTSLLIHYYNHPFTSTVQTLNFNLVLSFYSYSRSFIVQHFCFRICIARLVYMMYVHTLIHYCYLPNLVLIHCNVLLILASILWITYSSEESSEDESSSSSSLKPSPQTGLYGFLTQKIHAG